MVNFLKMRARESLAAHPTIESVSMYRPKHPAVEDAVAPKVARYLTVGITDCECKMRQRVLSSEILPDIRGSSDHFSDK
jgi:hypothetical protein